MASLVCKKLRVGCRKKSSVECVRHFCAFFHQKNTRVVLNTICIKTEFGSPLKRVTVHPHTADNVSEGVSDEFLIDEAPFK